MPLGSANAFAMAFGGGVDHLGSSKHFAIRAAQLDYIRTNFNSTDALALGLFNKPEQSAEQLPFSRRNHLEVLAFHQRWKCLRLT